MTRFVKMAGLCVAMGAVLLAGSTAWAQYVYVGGATFVAPAPTVVTYGPGIPGVYYSQVVVPRAPLVPIPPPPPAPIVVPPRVYLPGPVLVPRPVVRVRALYWR